MDNHTCVIVIPIYLKKPTLSDIVSLKRLNSVIGNKYDIKVICPESLDITAYLSILNINEDNIVRFDDKYFKSNETYSNLLTRYDFYNMFSDYDYMLIYQTDCYLIRDEIEKFCNLGYDYIGAPIVSNHAVWKTVPTVGNGGLSLRKIETFKDILNPDGWFAKEYWHIKGLKPENIKIEDLYFCQLVYQYYDMNIPKYDEEAVEFSIDMNPNICMNILKKHNIDFPMGIHAYPKNIIYWRNYISELNDSKLINECLTSNNDFFDLLYRKHLKESIKNESKKIHESDKKS